MHGFCAVLLLVYMTCDLSYLLTDDLFGFCHTLTKKVSIFTVAPSSFTRHHTHPSAHTHTHIHLSACAFLWHSSCLYGYGVTQNWHALIECWSSMLLRPVMFYFYIGWVVLWEDSSLTLPANTATLCTHSEQLSQLSGRGASLFLGFRCNTSSLHFSEYSQVLGQVQWRINTPCIHHACEIMCNVHSSCCAP